VLVEGFDGAVELAREAGVSVSDGWDDHFGFGRAVRVDVLGLMARWEEDVLAAGGEIRRRSAVRDLMLDGVGAVRGAVVDGEEIEADAVSSQPAVSSATGARCAGFSVRAPT
jgi:hypothetical protein